MADIRITEAGTMSSYKPKKAWRWLAPLALVATVGVAACGNDDDTVSTRAAAAGAASAAQGSDQHLQNKAAEIAERAESASGSDQHLRNQAAEIASASQADGGATQWDIADQAYADRLTGQADQVQQALAAGRQLGQAQVDSYVNQLASRAVGDPVHDMRVK
jgi:hypothetical protein